jgi:hypothetical protein
MLFSKTTGGFYVEDLHKDIPSDVIQITEEYWKELHAAQANGQSITASANGYPIVTGNVMVQQG